MFFVAVRHIRQFSRSGCRVALHTHTIKISLISDQRRRRKRETKMIERRPLQNIPSSLLWVAECELGPGPLHAGELQKKSKVEVTGTFPLRNKVLSILYLLCVYFVRCF